MISALSRATETGKTPQARLSLARTAELLASLRPSQGGPSITQAEAQDYAPSREHSGWGPGLRLKPPLALGETGMRWDLPADKCGSSEPVWTS